MPDMPERNTPEDMDQTPRSEEALSGLEEISFDLPNFPECRSCALRIQAAMEDEEGVHEVESGDEAGSLTLRFDPARANAEELKERARKAKDHLDQDYCHHTFVLENMDCADCARSVERAASRHKGVMEATVNFASGRLFLEFKCAETSLQDVLEDVRSLGYGVQTEEENLQRRRSRKPDSPFRDRRLLTTGASFLLLLAGVVIMLATSWPKSAAVAFMAAAIVVGGYSMARNGLFTVLRTRNVDMNVLMTVAVVGAAAIGEWVEGALVVVLFALGETLEGWAVSRSRRSIQELIDLSPEQAVLVEGGAEKIVPVEVLQIGNMLRVPPGARIPLDGVVTEGKSQVDESPITGESVPREKEEGSDLYAGTVNGPGSLRMRVTSLAGDSTLARIIEMVEEAQGRKAPSQRWVDSFARWYTPAVMVLAALTVTVPPLMFGAAWGDWVYRGLALLILSCPCALVISTPVSIVSAIGAAGRQGVLIKGGETLETAGDIKVVAFDKTGTLTSGVPEVTEILTFDGATENEVLAIAAAVEHDSEHPLAAAIRRAAAKAGISPLGADGSGARDFQALSGLGARARLNGATYFVGNSRLFREQGIPVQPKAEAAVSLRQERGQTVALVGDGERALGAVTLADEPRPLGRKSMQALHEAGVERILMLTGDNRQTAASVAEQLGLDDFRYELLPADKVETIEQLLAEHGKVAMVGDGINDAPALALSSVGIAMGAAGTDTALETADIALMTDDLARIPHILRLSRAARRVVRQNISFALGLKVVATLLVFPGFLTLWMAVIADTGASLVVILNGLRLLRYGKKEVSREREGSPGA